MKKLFLTLSIIISTFIGYANAAEFNEGFETAQFPPTGWTTYQVQGCKGFWNKVSYKSDAQLKQYIKGYSNGGDSCAHVNSSSLNNIGKVNPSSWLITPAIEISGNNYLHFMLSGNYAYNSSTLVPEAKKLKLDVLVSTVSADTLTFTDTIYTEIPSGLMNWKEITIDLGKYAGRNIHIAFHEHGTPQATPFLMNHLYIDDVKVNSNASSDLFISEVSELKSGSVATQPLTVKVKNTGATVENFKVGYKVDDNEPVIETVNTTLQSQSELSYTFTKNVEFQANGKLQKVLVWSQYDNDSNVANDTTSTSAEIFVNDTIPYVLGETASTDFLASYKRTQGGIIYGWGYYSTTKSWVYTSYTTASYLYTTKSYTLPKGKVKVKLCCTSTADATMNVYLTKSKGQYDQYKVGEQALITSLNAAQNNFYIDVPEDGNYIISFLPNTKGQVAMFGLEICKPYDDIIAKEITSPSTKSIVAQANVPISVKLKNEGLNEAKSVKVSYRINDASPVVETIASIPAGETVEHTFATKVDFSTDNVYNISAWSEYATDGDIHNDSTSTSITSYSPKAFPYSTSFETAEDVALWTSINVDNDDTYWGIEDVTSGNAMDGTHAFYINYESISTHNDFMVTPLINVKNATKARVAFYYATKTNYGGSKLAVYLTKSLDSDSILAKGVKLGEVNIDRLAYNYFAELVDIDEPGDYYIAIYNYGGKDALFVDEFRFDSASEVALVGLTSSETASAFELNDCEIKVSIRNCGVKDMTGGNVTYNLFENVNNTLNTKSSFTEAYTATIAPGEVYVHTFSKKATITEPGSYSFGATLVQSSDTDNKNNSYLTTGPTLYATRTIPYAETFETAGDRASVTINGGWQKGSSGVLAYEGSGLIQHTGKATENGDWAYLNRVYIEPNTYDFSFFWKTATSNVASTTSQSFDVCIGKAATPEAMSTTLFSAKDTINATVKCYKELMPLTITEAGYYYVGVKCTTTNTLGSLNLDNFRIALPAEGRVLTKDAAYTADFANNESEWYHYYPTSTSNQWKSAVDGDETYMTASRNYTSYNTTWKTPGIYESPAFHLNNGDKVVASFRYSMEEVTGTPLDGGSKMNLMLADKDHPDAFTTLVASGTESTVPTMATDTIEITKDGVYYFGVALESTVTTKFNLHALSLQLAQSSSVGTTDVATSTLFNVDQQNKLTIYGDFETAEIFSMNGTLVATISEAVTDLNNLPKGIYIIQLASINNKSVGKFVIQ